MEKKTVKILKFNSGGGAYGLTEYEISEDALKKHGKKISETEPDIFAVFVNHLTRKSREILGL